MVTVCTPRKKTWK